MESVVFFFFVISLLFSHSRTFLSFDATKKNDIASLNNPPNNFTWRIEWMGTILGQRKRIHRNTGLIQRENKLPDLHLQEEWDFYASFVPSCFLMDMYCTLEQNGHTSNIISTSRNDVHRPTTSYWNHGCCCAKGCYMKFPSLHGMKVMPIECYMNFGVYSSFKMRTCPFHPWFRSPIMVSSCYRNTTRSASQSVHNIQTLRFVKS
jgi:hypothetical protein